MVTTAMQNDVSALQKLLDALAAGWRVQSPVYYRKQFHSGQAMRDGYTFIIRRNQEMDVMVVPGGDKVRQLIELQRLQAVAA